MSLYKEVLMQHFRNPLFKEENGSCKFKIDGVNPSCGDNITLYFDLEEEKIVNLSYTGNGCAISMASADIMCEVFNRGGDEELINNFIDMVNGKEIHFPENEKLEVFKELVAYPARKNCAILPWKTLKESIQ